jgi:hypothetical protein
MKLSSTTLLIALGLSTLLVIVSIVGAVASFYWRCHDSRPASAATVEAEFLGLRARFADQQPLLDMCERRAREEGKVAGAVGPLRWFHTVIFDTRGRQRLVHITVPYWFARRSAGHAGQFRWLGELTFLDDTEFDPEAIQLSLDQIERHGPGLIVDHRHSSGGQFMAWVE